MKTMTITQTALAVATITILAAGIGFGYVWGTNYAKKLADRKAAPAPTV